MTNIATVPFTDLQPIDEINARAATKEGLDELAASIAARGLIQPLAVRPADGGKYQIIDGRRRYQAIAKLVRAKTLTKKWAVPVLVRNEDDAAALETSLAANTIRLPMHPVDQHTVFARLIDQGRDVDEISASFGITAKTVRQRLALAKLAQPIREAWKKGKLETAAAQAFAEHPDHEVQTALFERLRREGEWGLRESRIRSELNQGRAKVTCPEMKLVGVNAYLDAGGTLTESLFADERYVDDVPLLNKLVRDLIEVECARLRADGWAWAADAGDLPQRWDLSWRRWDVIDDDRWDGDYEFTAEEKARAGVVVEFRHNGELDHFWGVIRPAEAETAGEEVDEDDDQVDLEDAIDAAPSAGDEDDFDEGEEEGGDFEDVDDDADGIDQSLAIPKALAQTLSEVLTLAAAKALAEDPHLALRAAVAALTPGSSPSQPVKLHATGWPATSSLKRAAPTFDKLLERTAGESTEALLQALARYVAEALDMRTFSGSPRTASESALISSLSANAYLLAVRAEFNAADYFKRATKAVAIAALEEMEEAGAIGSLSSDLADAKKAELAEMAAESAARCGWLPPELRHPAYALQVPEAVAA